MLKRQRSVSSFVPDVYTPPDPAAEMIEERVAKRRRQFAPPPMDKGKSPWRAGESDGEEDVEIDEQTAGRSAPNAQARRLEQAGEYKNVNTLLHDLHAEQRHRVLFSSNAPPAHLPFAQYDVRDYSEPHHHPFTASTRHAPTFPDCGPHPLAPYESQKQTPSFMISIPTKDSAVVDHVEVQRVTERYEGTNRLLGSLFLSRRRQSDYQDTEGPR